MKNKITLSEFYECIDCSLDNIEDDVDEEKNDIPYELTKVVTSTINELYAVKERIAKLAINL